MTDLNGILAATHQANISRYRRLLRTPLTELERPFVERRLSEESRALAELRSGRPRQIPGLFGPATTDTAAAQPAMSGGA